MPTDPRVIDGDWLSDEKVDDLCLAAARAATSETGWIEVEAMVLCRLLDEVMRRREEQL
jgi:hypothetical protein